VEVRRKLEASGFSFPRLNVSFQIVKGGTGKTSLSFSFAVRAHQYGARVLAIDLDQQGNLTRSFGVDARDRPVWLNLVRDRLPIRDAIVDVSEGLTLLPSNLNNSRLDTELSASPANLRDLVGDRLAPVRDAFDLVIMDCPPAINKINTAVTCASDLIVVPINPDPYAMDGLEFTMSELERIRGEFKLGFAERIVWNRYDARERLGAAYMHALAERPERAAKLLPVVIRTDATIKNAVFDGRSIFDLPKRSTIREDIDQLTRELLGLDRNAEKAVA
jgi:chromosome partitioning protein